MLDVLTQYEILRFCRLGLNQMKFYRTKTWDILTENQISAGCRSIENATGRSKSVFYIAIKGTLFSAKNKGKCTQAHPDQNNIYCAVH